MTTTPRRLMNTPIFAISAILIRPLPKMMALGGVATGIMKAHEAESVAGIISISGLTRMATATEARIGRIISVVAVLEVSSVRKVMVRQMTMIIKNGGTPANPTNRLPITLESPVT